MTRIPEDLATTEVFRCSSRSLYLQVALTGLNQCQRTVSIVKAFFIDFAASSTTEISKSLAR